MVCPPQKKITKTIITNSVRIGSPRGPDFLRPPRSHTPHSHHSPARLFSLSGLLTILQNGGGWDLLCGPGSWLVGELEAGSKKHVYVVSRRRPASTLS